jgi:hypothetical protein
MSKIFLTCIILFILAGIAGYYLLRHNTTLDTESSNSSRLEHGAEFSFEPNSSPSTWNDVDDKLHINLIDVPPGVPGLNINHELRAVELCGGVYKAKQIRVEPVDVDIVQRIASILRDNLEKGETFCTRMFDRASEEGGVIGENEELDITIENAPNYGIGISFARQPETSFPLFVFAEQNKITTIDGGLFGSLKP